VIESLSFGDALSDSNHMKLLLTSAGLANYSIRDALEGLVGKPLDETTLAFIPTAANVEKGDKEWLIKDLSDARAIFFSVDIVDISAIPKELWLPRLEAVDVLLFGGGNTFHLMHWIEKSGLKDTLPKLLETKVYVGISAGSIVACPTLLTSQSDRTFYYGDEAKGYTNDNGLGLVNFHVRPHLNSPYFPNIREPLLEKLAAEIKEPLYGIDDETAIVVEDGNISIISEGVWKKFN